MEDFAPVGRPGLAAIETASALSTLSSDNRKKAEKKHKFTIYGHLFVSVSVTLPLPPPRLPLLSPFTLLFLNYNIRLKSGRPDLKIVWFSNSPDFRHYLKSGQYKSERPYFGIFKIVRYSNSLDFRHYLKSGQF